MRTFRDDLHWSWRSWRTIPGRLTAAAAIWLVVLAGAVLVGIGLTATAGFALWALGMPATIATPIVVGTLTVPPFFATWFAAASWLSAAVTIADGRGSRIGDFFRPVEVETLLAVSLVQWAAFVAIAFTAGQPAALWIAGGCLTVGFLTLWSGFIAYETQGGVLASLKASAALAIAHPFRTGQVLGGGLVLNAAGGALLGVGLLVTIPFSALLAVAVFRSLTRQPLAR